MLKYNLFKTPTAIVGITISLLILFIDFKSINPGAIEASIGYSPSPLVISEKTTIVYEIGISNKLTSRLEIHEMVIRNESGKILETLNSDDLKRTLQPDDERPATTLSLKAGAHGMFYIELVLDGDQLPESLDHTIVTKDSLSGNLFTDHVSAPVSHNTAVVLGPPLRSGLWVAIYNPEWPRGHRRVIYKREGVDRIPGRFAIDFMKMDNDGRYFTGDENVIDSWYGYGADVLAVADGVVGSTRDDFKESKTISDHPNYPAEMATGNYISIKIADNRYVFYEHLKPHSILVKNGQVVRRGQAIAKVGFTGQTTGPHLHLHVADSDSPLGAEGVPFVFKKFELQGFYPDFDIFGKGKWSDSNRVVNNEHPRSNSVIRF